jgi:hypothetical protein
MFRTRDLGHNGKKFVGLPLYDHRRHFYVANYCCNVLEFYLSQEFDRLGKFSN